MIQLRHLIEALICEIPQITLKNKPEELSPAHSCEEIEFSIPMSIHHIEEHSQPEHLLDEKATFVAQEVFAVMAAGKTYPLIEKRVISIVKIELRKLVKQISLVPIDERRVLWDFSQRLLVLFVEEFQRARLWADVKDSELENEFDSLTQSLYQRLSPKMFKAISLPVKQKIYVDVEAEKLEQLSPRTTGMLKLKLRVRNKE